MTELDRAERTALLREAQQLLDHATHLLTTRQTLRDGAAAARASLSARPQQITVPSSAAAEHSASGPTQEEVAPLAGQLLPLSTADAPALRAVLDGEHLARSPQQLEAWLHRVTASFPAALTAAEQPGFFGRLFGRGASTEEREQATAMLQHELATSRHPAVQHDLAGALPPHHMPGAQAAGGPLPGAEILSALGAVVGPPVSHAQLLPTRELAAVADAAQDAHALGAALHEGLESVQQAAQAAIDRRAEELLAQTDMEHFRSQVSLRRFPTSALERAGVGSVADLLRRSTTQLANVDGISSETASTLRIAARQLEARTREHATIDLHATEDPSITALLASVKRVLDLRVRAAGAEADLHCAQRLQPLAENLLAAAQYTPNTGELDPSLGGTPALLWGADAAATAALRTELGAFTQRQAARRDGSALSPAALERARAPAPEDFEAHPSDYFALLTELGFEQQIAQNTHGDLSEELIGEIDRVELDTTLLNIAALRTYQHFGARFAVRQRKVIIGDEMGLGKTIEALAAISHLTRHGAAHTLVICPAAVLANWLREIRGKSHLTAHRLHGPDRAEALGEWQREGGVAVTTFATLSRLLADGPFEHLDTLVVDEAHKIKNPSARRSRSTLQQIRRAHHAILMTGTPIENRLEEFRTLIGYLDPELARTAEGLPPLSFRQHISTTYLRRNQEDVLKELPELNEIEDWIEFSDEDRAAYEEQVLAGSFMGMRRAAMTSGTASNKVDRMSEIIDDATQNSRKVIVFSFFRSVIETLPDLLPTSALYGPISGSVSADRRQEIIDDFTQAPGGAVLLAQIQAGGEGLNIQAASIVILCEPQLKPSLETQAIARAHRMGQQRSVQVHRLLSDEGTDPRIVELLAEKTEIFDEYARESAAKDLNLEAMETDDVAIGKQVVAEERERLGVGAAAV